MNGHTDFYWFCFSAEPRLIQAFKVLRHFQLVHNRDANHPAYRGHFSQTREFFSQILEFFSQILEFTYTTDSLSGVDV